VNGHIEKYEFRYILLDELEILLASQVRNIIHRTSDEIIDANNSVSTREQEIGKMRGQETRGAGDHRGGL